MRTFEVFIVISLLNMIKSEISANAFLKLEASKPRTENISTEQHKNQNSSTTHSPEQVTKTTPIKDLSTLLTSSPSNLITTTVTAGTTVGTTTAKPENKNSSAIEKNNTKFNSFKPVFYPPNYFCKCDLIPNFCDISCCCDIDCNSEALKTFQCKEDHLTLSNYQFQYGLPSCKINEGWFCLFIDNSNRKIRKVHNSKVKSNKYFWPDPLLLNLQNEEQIGFYKEGDPILLYNDLTEEIETLDMPYSFINSVCHVYEPVRHLQSFVRECVMPSERLQSFFNSLIKKITKSSILRFQKNSESNEIITKKHAENVGDCIKADLYYCAGNISSCKEWSNTSFEVQDEFSYRIKINLHHNFTSIEKCQIYLIEEIGSMYSLQNFEINFLTLKETIVPRHSGPLGYEERKPVIVSKLISVNESAEYTEKQAILSYFHVNSSKHTNEFHITMPGSSQGDCINETANVLNFGENFFIQCNIRLNDTIIDSTTNFTTICYEIQNKFFEILLKSQHFSPDLELYVSEFGLPRNKTEHWIKMQVSSPENANILAMYHHESDSFSCQNMIITVKNVFFTENVIVNGIPNQNIIKIAKVEMGSRVDLSFKLEDEITVPVNFQVMFYDMLESNSYSNSIGLESNSSSFTILIFLYFVILCMRHQYNMYIINLQ